jgi:hypothetical protein
MMGWRASAAACGGDFGHRLEDLMVARCKGAVWASCDSNHSVVSRGRFLPFRLLLVRSCRCAPASTLKCQMLPNLGEWASKALWVPELGCPSHQVLSSVITAGENLQCSPHAFYPRSCTFCFCATPQTRLLRVSSRCNSSIVMPLQNCYFPSIKHRHRHRHRQHAQSILAASTLSNQCWIQRAILTITSRHGLIQIHVQQPPQNRHCSSLGPRRQRG